MKKAILISLLCIVYFPSCTKQVNHVDPIDSFLVQNFNYKVGTYWIYKDSLTGEEDSFFVSSNIMGSAPGTPGSNSAYDYTDYIDIIILQKNDQAKWSVSLTNNAIGMEYEGNTSITYVFFLIVPYMVGPISTGSGGSEDSGYVLSINNNYTINSNNYSNVVIMTHVGSTHDNTFYVSSDVGIIKMNLIQGIHNIWELERYKIVK